jgi:hypothetical protein
MFIEDYGQQLYYTKFASLFCIVPRADIEADTIVSKPYGFIVKRDGFIVYGLFGHTFNGWTLKKYLSKIRSVTIYPVDCAILEDNIEPSTKLKELFARHDIQIDNA